MAKQSNGGGMADACDDICCICLEGFSRGRVSTVPEKLKLPNIQDLLEAIEHEKKRKAELLRNAACQITPGEQESPSRRATEAQVQEQLRQYMINMGRRYQFSPSEAHLSFTFFPLNSSNSNGESSAGDNVSLEFLTAQFSSISNRDSIMRRTRSWKERLLSRNNSFA